jgi:hypothetical protein
MRTLKWNLTLFGIVSMAGVASAHPWDGGRERPVQPMREGSIPMGMIRNDIAIRAMPDGRGDRDTVEKPMRNAMPPSREHEHADKALGQASQWKPPVTKDVALRVTLGDGFDAQKALNVKASQSQHQDEVKTYPGREAPASPVPIKKDILLQVSGGGEVSADFAADGRGEDDPKLARMHDNIARNQEPRVGADRYPGRYENLPNPVEASMTRSRTHSAQGDSPGDKDAP